MGFQVGEDPNCTGNQGHGEENPVETDSVNHPSHYNDGKIEVMEFIADKRLNFARGNTVKYICRAGKKKSSNEIEDLQKAAWYLNFEIQSLIAERDKTAAPKPDNTSVTT